MKTIAKWVLILWSLLCLIGVITGMANVSDDFTKQKTDTETAAAAVGVGCGMGIWLVLWGAIALPATLIYALTGKKQPVAVEVVGEKKERTPTLCAHCGKYYDGTPQFCPNCGKEVR